MTMNVLVVDDDKVDRMMVRELLDGECSIVEAQTGDEVLKMLDEQQVDCVLLDYLLPGTDSLKLLADVSSRNLPVVMLTGEGNEHVAVNAMKHGAQDYINKRSLTADLLRKTISNAVQTIGLRRSLADKQLELVHANKELQRGVEELRALNTDLENFIHIAAHDLREPLNSLCLYCDLLEKDIGQDLSKNAKTYLDSLRRNTRRLASLIDDLRALSRIVHAPQQLETIDLAEVIEEVLPQLEGLMKTSPAKIKLHNLGQIQGCRPLIVQLYTNLISNALKYGSEKKLLIEATCAEENGDKVLGIKNSGSHIPLAELSNVFQPFHRLPNSRNREGTGMGLTLCKKIIEKHGGKIWIESSPEDGVHVRFKLGRLQYDQDLQ